MSKLADELKKAFLQGNVPNETNYQKLIELADPQLGNGLKVKEINVAGKDNNPATTQTVIELNNGAGIGFDESGAAKLNLDPSLAIEVNGYNQLSVKLADGSGLEKTSKGLGVKCGPGIKTDTSGLSVSLASEGGLVQDSTDGGLRVHLYTEGNTDTSGLTIDNKNQLQVKLPEQVAGKVNYLKQDKDGLHLTQEGIDSMKSAMAAVSKQALDDAKKDTSNGFIALDSKSKKSQTEKDIANALNAAYADGRSHEKECNAVIDFLNSNLRSDWKDKIVNGTAVMSAFNKTDGTFYTKGEKEGDEPQPFSHDCLWVFNLDSNGRFERLADNHPEDVKAYNPGLYFIVGLLSKEGKPDQKGEYVTEYASLVLCSHRAPVVVAYAKLGTDSPSLFANPVADPGAFKAGYDSGKKDKVALRKAVEDAVNGAIGATQVKDGKWTPLQGEGGTIGERAVADAMKMSYDAGDKDGFNRGSTDTVAINAAVKKAVEQAKHDNGNYQSEPEENVTGEREVGKAMVDAYAKGKGDGIIEGNKDGNLAGSKDALSKIIKWVPNPNDDKKDGTVTVGSDGKDLIVYMHLAGREGEMREVWWVYGKLYVAGKLFERRGSSGEYDYGYYQGAVFLETEKAHGSIARPADGWRESMYLGDDTDISIVFVVTS